MRGGYDEGLHVLKHTAALTSLDLDLCRNIPDAGLKALKHTLNLVSLEFEECHITNEGLKELKHVPTINSLEPRMLQQDDRRGPQKVARERAVSHLP